MAPPPTPAQAAEILHELPLNGPIIEIFLNGDYRRSLCCSEIETSMNEGLFTCLFIFSIGTICASRVVIEVILCSNATCR
jgi:hypothetical protein